jgi:type VII secretion protein EccB
MQSRRDLVQAYQYSAGRLVAALTTGDTGQGRSPFRQSGLGITLGIIIAAVASGGLAVYGLVRPAPSAAWRTPGTIVVRQETGTRFVYLGGQLHPVANYSSALLAASAAGASAPAIQYVPGSKLTSVPEGKEIGIPGAPDALPAAGALLSSRWAVCTDPATPGGTVADLAPGAMAPVPPDDRMLVVRPGHEYVIWDNVRFPVHSTADLVALGLGNAEPVKVSAAWLGELLPGPRLAATPIRNAGRPGATVAGTKHHVGDLFTTGAGGVQQHYVLLADGLAPVSRTEFALRQAVPGVRAPASITPADVAAAPASSDKSLLISQPDILGGSVFQPGAWAMCVLPRGAGPGGRAGLATASPSSIAAARLTGGRGALVPRGAGVLAAAPATGSAAGGLGLGTQQLYLITDAGEKFPVSGSGTAAALGYGGVTAAVLPAPVLGLIPTGPDLSVAAAGKTVPWATG